MSGFTSRVLLASGLGFVSCALPCAADAGFAGPERASISSTLDSKTLAMRLGLDGRGSYLGLGLDALEGESYLEACLDVSADPERNLGLSLGPGSVSGSLRLLAEPTSLSALCPGEPVVVDRSLSSRSAIVGRRAGALSLFGIAAGRGPIAFAVKPGNDGRDLGATVGGFSLGLIRPLCRLELIASASYPAAPSQVSGWSPDPYAMPAFAACEAGAPFAEAALIAERGGAARGALACVAGSYGSLSEPGLAFRLESWERAGDLDLRLRAAAADPAFRALYGEPEKRLAGAVAEARLAMRHASSFTVSLQAEAAGRGLSYAPKWGDSGAFKLVLPVGVESGRFLEARCEARRTTDEEEGGSCTILLQGGRAERNGFAKLGAELSWLNVVEGLRLDLETSLGGAKRQPRLGLDFELDLFQGGSKDSPVLAKGALELELPWGSEGTLELGAGLPVEGVALAPVAAGAAATAFALTLRYKSSFALAARRVARP